MTRLVLLSIALVGLSGTPALAVEPPDTDASVGRKAYDLAFMRPLNFLTTVVSLAGALVAYPVAWPFGGQDHVVDYLVKEPIDRTFRRPLGDF